MVENNNKRLPGIIFIFIVLILYVSGAHTISIVRYGSGWDSAFYTNGKECSNTDELVDWV